MKKINVYAMLFIALLSLQSCEKDLDETTNNRETVGKGFKIVSYSDPSARSVQSDMLSFESEAEFYSTRDSLEQAFELYSAQFERDNKDLTDEEFNDKIKNENIDLEQPLTDFENQYNFNSLRKKINQDEQDWLNSSNPDFNACPQLFPIEDHVERCLWNEKGEVMIAGKIYKYEDDRYILINDGSFSKLSLINSGDQNILNDESVFVENLSSTNASSSDCTKRSFYSVTHEGFNGSTKVVCANRLLPKSWQFGKNKMYASTYNYRWNALTDKFDKFAVDTEAGAVGQRYVACYQETQHNAVKKKRSSSVVYGFERDNSFGAKYASTSCTLKSTHKGALMMGININNIPFVQ